jgi:hypothetical protein
MNSPEKVKRRNLYPEERSREQAAGQRARHERLKGSTRILALTRRDVPSRMNSPEKVKRRSRYLRSEAKSKPPSNALGRLSLRLNPVHGFLLRQPLP